MRTFHVQVDLHSGTVLGASGYEPEVEQEEGGTLTVRKAYSFAGGRFFVWGRFFHPAGAQALEARLAALRLDDLRPGLAALDGDFVIVAVDEAGRRAAVCADRNGQYRAYLHHQGGVLTVSNSLKQMVRLMDGGRLDSWGVYQLLTLRWMLDPYTVVEGVTMLAPGCVETFTAGARAAERYYEPVDFDPDYYRTPRECVAGLDRALSAVCEKRLAGGRPPCLMLSGGIDSAALLVYMCRMAPGQVHTVTFGIEGGTGPEFDEARVTARSLGTRHTEWLLPRADFVDVYIRGVAESDTPYYASGVMKGIQRHLEAQGHDWSLFLGTDTRLHTPPTDGVRALGRWINRHLASPRLAAEVSTGRYWPDYFLKRLLPRGSYEEYVLKVYLGHRSPVADRAVPDEHLARMYAEMPPFTGREGKDEFFKKCVSFSYRGQYTDDLNYLVSSLESPGVDVHVPFCDHTFVEACNRVPYRIGARSVFAPNSGRRYVPFVDKFVLRELVKGKLPPESLVRRKMAPEEMGDFWAEPGVRRLTLQAARRWGDALVESLDGVAREGVAAMLRRTAHPGFASGDVYTAHSLFTLVYLCVMDQLCRDPGFDVEDGLRDLAGLQVPAFAA